MKWQLAVVALCACSEQATTNVVERSPRMVEVRAGTPIAAVSQLAAYRHIDPLQLPALDVVGKLGNVTRIAQTIDGMRVWGGELRVHSTPDGETVSGRLVRRDQPRSRRISLSRDEAIARAAGPVQQALARTVWYPSGEALIAAWAVDAYTIDGGATRTILAGDDGRVLERYSLVADAFSYKVYGETTGELHPFDGPQQDATPHPTGVPDFSYPPYLPGPSTIVTDGLLPGDPWLPDGATETNGNNVDAYVDFNAPTGLTDGDFRASVTAPNTFGHVYDVTLGPMANREQQEASVTSLFYVLNWLHDFWYQAGFTEVAGNAQRLNYMRGGVEGDPILAEAQDNALGGSRNNANMATPDDGMSPRMQVYLWTGKDDKAMTLTPSNRQPRFGTAAFGPGAYDVSGSVIVGTDGSGANPTDGCEAIANAVSGKLVVVDRGNCTFRKKTQNVQDAGGIGVIVVNNVASTSPPAMGDDSSLTAAINIPAVSLTDTEGALLKQDIANGAVTATIHRALGVELDGTLDSTLIAHEFGHYLHHRLTLCGNAICRAMSEGWGDFSALMLILREGDNLDGAFPFSVYATQGYSDDPGYYGIRRAPYSASFAINSLSYRHMADGEALPTSHPFLASGANSEVHNAGEIWASALWEGYVALQKAGPSFNEVRAKMAKYVVEGLAMTPTEATPMEARDAILAVADPVDHDILLAAFARRGFGSCAEPPPPSSVDFVGLRESNIIAGKAEVVMDRVEESCDADGILDTGETAHLKIHVANKGHAPLTNVMMRVTSNVPGLTILSDPTSLDEMAAGASLDLDVEVTLASGLTKVVTGDLLLEVSSLGGCADSIAFPLATRFNIDDIQNSSTSDSFDTAQSAWVPVGDSWSHEYADALDGYWNGADLGVQTDARLVSPLLHAAKSGSVKLTFTHRYEFEMSDGKGFDGGVIEYSIGDTDNWQDLSTIATVPYNDPLATDTGNVLAGRAAFAGTSSVYPDKEKVTIDLGTKLAGQAFRLRFRIGTDGGVGAAGWDIDNLVMTGLTNKPFPSTRPDNGHCGPDEIVSGGGGCCDSRAAPNGLLPLSVLALMLRRRRRR